MKPNELIARYAAGETQFSGLKLPGVNLVGADLIGIVLNEANCTEPIFSLPILTGLISLKLIL